MAKRRRNSPRDYPRTARLNELLREILASELDRLGDDELGVVTITGIDVDKELTRAIVYVSSLDGDPAALLERLAGHRGQLKKAIGMQARLRRVPDLQFTADPAVEAGGRVEEILAELRDAGELE
jgi:ribosome-binding factor A